MENQFKSIVCENKPYPVFCYRSGKFVYEEQLVSGRLTCAGFNAAGYMLNVLDERPTRNKPDIFAQAQTFALTIDGRSLEYGWTAEGFAEETETNENGAEILTGVLTLYHEAAQIRVRVKTALDGTPFLTRWLEIENAGPSPINVGNLMVLGGVLERIDGWKDYVNSFDPADLYSVGAFTYSAWAHEGAFKFDRLPAAGYSIYGRYRADRYRHPMYILRSNAAGGIFTVQFAWTGGYSFDFNLRADGGSSELYYAIRTDGPEPFIRLAPGECYRSPAVHAGWMFGALDDAVNTMHTHLRRSVFTLPAARGMRGGWLEAGMGAERIMDIQATKHFADTAAAVGAETLIIDAGWYCPLGKEGPEWHARAGDWYPDAEHYPNGIGEIRDYIHEKGLLFGLWLDLERIGPLSQLFARHPDWAMKTAAGTQTSLLDLTNPEVAAWTENELARVITEYGLDLFRLDYNVGHTNMFNPEQSNGGIECCVARYYAAADQMYARLRRRFPDVVFENCAGGGGRTDLGFVANFTHTWVTDWQVAPRSVAITNGMTMALPPEYVDRLVSGMNSHTRGSLELTVRQTLFGRPSTNDYNAVGSEFNTEQIDFVRHTFSIYKEFIRPFAPEGKIFHHTPEVYGEQPHGDVILERAAADGSRVVLGIFRLCRQPDGTNDTAVTVIPRGIDGGKTYRVTFDNSGSTAEIAGYTLKNDGIRVSLGGVFTSELILLEACGEA